MLISVIIPTYKPQDYLWVCLDSLYNQTLRKELYEVVLVLNGCKVPYHSQIINWIKEHPQMRMKYIQTEVTGVSNARNIAIEAAEGDYITFLDDDDYFSKNTLFRLYEKATPNDIILFKPLAFLDGENECFAYSRTFEYYEKRRNEKLLFYKVRRNFSGPVMKLFPRDVINEKRFDVSFKNGEDSLYMFLISDRMRYVRFAEDDAIYYRRVRTNSAATCSKSFKTVFLNSCRLSFEYTKIFIRNPIGYSFIFYMTRVLGSVRAIINYKKVTF